MNPKLYISFSIVLIIETMPYYELNLLLRNLPHKEVVSCLKRSAKLVWDEYGSIAKIEYLGSNQLPHKIQTQDGTIHNHGIYFVYHISLGAEKLRRLHPELKLDQEILRSNFFIKDQSVLPENYVCTLEEELKPPVYRESIQPLLKDRNFRPTVRR